MSDLENLLKLKIRMLIEGCNIEDNFVTPNNTYLKQVHLYKHSIEHMSEIPDDILIHLGTETVIVRLRLNSSSKIKLSRINEECFVFDANNNTRYNVSFLAGSPELSKNVVGTDVGKICSILGNDLVGVIPSNYCFYFGKGDECKFCEIWQTYKTDLRSMKAIKTNLQITSAIGNILSHNHSIRHLAVTSGNIKSYDYTAKLFCSIGNDLKNLAQYIKLQDKLATLMPPDDFSIIDQIHASGFNKIYFPIEVFDYARFKQICPGKDKYGYQRMLDALSYALNIFGVGNVYTNLVYGIQTEQNSSVENKACMEAVDGLLSMSILPVFTIYHYSGSNQLGSRSLDYLAAIDFFRALGAAIHKKNILPPDAGSVIFSKHSLSNTAYNESYLLAKQ